MKDLAELSRLKHRIVNELSIILISFRVFRRKSIQSRFI